MGALLGSLGDVIQSYLGGFKFRRGAKLHRGGKTKYQATPGPHHVAINSTELAVLGKVGKSLGAWGLLPEEPNEKAHEEDYDHETCDCELGHSADSHDGSSALLALMDVVL